MRSNEKFGEILRRLRAQREIGRAAAVDRLLRNGEEDFNYDRLARRETGVPFRLREALILLDHYEIDVVLYDRKTGRVLPDHDQLVPGASSAETTSRRREALAQELRQMLDLPPSS